MKKINILFILAVSFLLSCKTTDIINSGTSLYVENKTDAVIEVIIKRENTDLYTKQFQINIGEKAQFFWLSGLERDGDPATSDSAIVYYKDKILIDSINGTGLLNIDNYLLRPEATYTKKGFTYYECVFTIDENYISSHLANE